MRTRLAVALGILLFAGALLVTFLPTSPTGATCGNWLDPEWSDSHTQQMLNRGTTIAIRAENVNRPDLAARARAIAAGVEHSHLVCSSALSTRRTMALVLLGFAVLMPAAVWFVGGGLRPRPARAPSASPS